MSFGRKANYSSDFFPVRKKIASDRRFGLSGGHSLYSSTAMLYKMTNCQFKIKVITKDYLQMYKTLQLNHALIQTTLQPSKVIKKRQAH